jgi:DNA helicase-2/ATP-dependent DNA helicase PcrA
MIILNDSLPKADTLDLNPGQHSAATFAGGHALVLAGAGCGKTRTIIARCEYLIAGGVPASRIYVPAFTRKAADQIIERVAATLGSAARGLKASTFHKFCLTLIHAHPQLFGCQRHTVIDRDDQLHLMRAIRGGSKGDGLPTAGEITDIYSLARNTRCQLAESIARYDEELVQHEMTIAGIVRGYEARKRKRKYLDFDDILEIVAKQLRDNPQICSVIAGRFAHVLADEFQDTNNLQWALLDSLKDHATLFCVGDDAQSIYGFRGADFTTVHSFQERLPGATVLKLADNYRSTQEILNLSNWVLRQSPLAYGKELRAIRGTGLKPCILDFGDEWSEASWIAEDLQARRAGGASWSEHMILVRGSWFARAVQTQLIQRNIPYRYVGGTGLLQTAHIRDAVSVLRIVANPEDELAWVRYLHLWPGIGEKLANRIVEKILDKPNLADALNVLSGNKKAGGACRKTIELVAAQAGNPGEAFRASVSALEPLLAEQYADDWNQRRRDFELVEELAGKHTSISGFIEEYILAPVYGSSNAEAGEDMVTLITVHSAKGTEAKVCYVINVSPCAFPSEKTMRDSEHIEEERRVLYVALTRAQNELIITRRDGNNRAASFSVSPENQKAAVAYFLNELPADLVS